MTFPSVVRKAAFLFVLSSSAIGTYAQAARPICCVLQAMIKQVPENNAESLRRDLEKILNDVLFVAPEYEEKMRTYWWDIRTAITGKNLETSNWGLTLLEIFADQKDYRKYLSDKTVNTSLKDIDEKIVNRLKSNLNVACTTYIKGLSQLSQAAIDELFEGATFLQTQDK